MRRVVAAAGLGWVVMAAAGCTGQQGVLGSELGEGGDTDTDGSAGTGAVQRSLVNFVSFGFVDPAAAEKNANYGRCINATYDLYDDGVLQCRVALIMPGGRCEGTSLVEADAQLEAVAKSQLEARDCSDDSVPCDARVCELLPATDDNLDACLNEESPSKDFGGWCFIDPVRGIGDQDLAANCPPTEAGALRYRMDMLPTETKGILFVCVAETKTVGTLGGAEEVAEPCIPRDEYRTSFSSFGTQEIIVEDNSTECASGICLVNHFQGRVSCPYGGSWDPEDHPCYVPEASGVPVEAEVAPQRVARRAEDVVTCSCRCDGTGPGPYCSCPEGTECVHLIDDLGEELGDLAGSYCIKEGTAYDPTHEPSSDTCDREQQNCSETE
jgi:hypothetical protein